MGFAIVTGASSGIGLSLVKILAQKKIPLIITSTQEYDLQNIQKILIKNQNIDCFYLAIDLTDNEAPNKLYHWILSKNIKIKYLFNNAGYALSGENSQLNLDEQLKMLRLNINSVVSLTHLFLNYFKQNNEKSYIINIASTSAYQAMPGMSLYAASKSFILSFTRGIAQENKNTPVKIKVICPGGTNTNFTNRANLKSEKILKLGQKYNMSSNDVANIIIKNLESPRIEIVPGLLNKLHKIFCKFLPKNWLEKSAKKIYLPKQN